MCYSTMALFAVRWVQNTHCIHESYKIKYVSLILQHLKAQWILYVPLVSVFKILLLPTDGIYGFCAVQRMNINSFSVHP